MSIQSSRQPLIWWRTLSCSPRETKSSWVPRWWQAWQWWRRILHLTWMIIWILHMPLQRRRNNRLKRRKRGRGTKWNRERPTKDKDWQRKSRKRKTPLACHVDISGGQHQIGFAVGWEKSFFNMKGISEILPCSLQGQWIPLTWIGHWIDPIATSFQYSSHDHHKQEPTVLWRIWSLPLWGWENFLRQIHSNHFILYNSLGLMIQSAWIGIFIEPPLCYILILSHFYLFT